MGMSWGLCSWDLYSYLCKSNESTFGEAQLVQRLENEWTPGAGLGVAEGQGLPLAALCRVARSG